MSENKLAIEQIEEALRDNPKFIQVVMEQSRYKQQCRLRALELAFHNQKVYINDSLVNQSRIQPKTDVLKDAESYYKWLVEILPDFPNN